MQAGSIGWIVTSCVFFIVYLLTFKQDVTPWFAINDLLAFSWIFAVGAACAHFNVIEKISSKYGIVHFIIAFGIAITIFSIDIPIGFKAIKDAFIALIMIYATISLCRWISPRVNLNKNAIYAQTFLIFLLSWPFQAMANVLTEKILHSPYWLIMPVQLIVGIAMPIITILIINKIESKFKTHWISFILGR